MSKPDLISKSAGRLLDRGPELDVDQSYWQGVLREFRNHLSIVMARSGQLSTALPGNIALQSADCLADIDGSASLMEGLLTWMDAALVPGTQRLCEIGDVIARATEIARTMATTMAMTWLRPWMTLSAENHPAVVRNRGTAVESALAALIIELARGPEFSSTRISPNDGIATVANVKISVHTGRGDLRIALDSDRARKAGEPSWRLSLAKALLAAVGGEVQATESTTEGTLSSTEALVGLPTCGFEVRFRLQ